MTSTCPEGHTSSASDYCDVCGSPIGGLSAGIAEAGRTSEPSGADQQGASVPVEPPVGQHQTCPNCSAINGLLDLFCEACGYDFTTGALPLGATPAPPTSTLDNDDSASATPGPGTAEPVNAAESPDEPDTSQGDVDAEPALGGEADVADSSAQASAAPVPVNQTPAAEEPMREAPAPTAEPVPTGVGAPSSERVRPTYVPPSRELGGDWVVEVWIDPLWYGGQAGDQPCPSPAVPEIVALHSTSVLVGRPSASRNVRPDVDCGSDTGVSRRHALLTSDGRRWWVEDLGSSNGTFVGGAAGPLPSDPIRGRVEIDADDRIYVGAWTRLVVRRAVAADLGHR